MALAPVANVFGQSVVCGPGNLGPNLPMVTSDGPVCLTPDMPLEQRTLTVPVRRFGHGGVLIHSYAEGRDAHSRIHETLSATREEGRGGKLSVSFNCTNNITSVALVGGIDVHGGNPAVIRLTRWQREYGTTEAVLDFKVVDASYRPIDLVRLRAKGQHFGARVLSEILGVPYSLSERVGVFPLDIAQLYEIDGGKVAPLDQARFERRLNELGANDPLVMQYSVSEDAPGSTYAEIAIRYGSACSRRPDILLRTAARPAWMTAYYADVVNMNHGDQLLKHMGNYFSRRSCEKDIGPA